MDNSANRNYFAALETKVDELEEERRRAAASKAGMEGEARQSTNRAKRLLGEVEMMRSEYEIVSEEAVGLRGSLAATEVCVCVCCCCVDDKKCLLLAISNYFGGMGGVGCTTRWSIFPGFRVGGLFLYNPCLC